MLMMENDHFYMYEFSKIFLIAPNSIDRITIDREISFLIGKI